MSTRLCEVLIIGGGPGGLTAAVYLRRFRRDVIVADKGNSRLGLIPVSHNYPGFPGGVPGRELLGRLRQQLECYGGGVDELEITGLTKVDDVFVATHEGGEIRAAAVLLATGVADAGLPVEGWYDAVASGALRLCPVCDGYDILDKRVAVVSQPHNRTGHALFMRTFSCDVTLFEREPDAPLSPEEEEKLRVAGVRYVASPLKGVTLTNAMEPVLHTEDGADYRFDVFYPMLGETARSGLAQALGAKCGECDKLIVDDHQRTTVPGLYAVGDVVLGLNQISVATGHAAIAATAIHNALPWQFRRRTG
ncbi:thioredoxin reductase (NADPH) [Pseudoduganella flava]|uniref:NAD(P)-binding protein n=1 Tax=Pseudoduganella flava TaxID=871742 RepID=A0A562PQJ8_9BURK|nr:NAD(P)/FAD-dependent oxidoreductase [Pseudoduganella flava]QGZ37888.1 NAD(P)-binding protein [Pseudoduganella flava]TWI46721.1 thioredoxin reductase (NADPH) [Pseudoduganella flava]